MYYNVLLPDVNSISDSKRSQNISIIFHISALEGFGTGGLAGKTTCWCERRIPQDY